MQQEEGKRKKKNLVGFFQNYDDGKCNQHPSNVGTNCDSNIAPRIDEDDAE